MNGRPWLAASSDPANQFSKSAQQFMEKRHKTNHKMFSISPEMKKISMYINQSVTLLNHKFQGQL